MASPPSPAPPFTLLLTGLSSTGKTTLSRLLSHVFPGMLLIHQDDFYYTDSQIPIDPTSKLQDWDCVQAFDFHKMAEAVHWVKVNGKARDGVRSLTAESAVGKEKEIDMVGGEEIVRALSEKVEKRLGGKKRTLLVVEGILMLQQGSEVEREADLKMFLRAPRERAKQRREGREGYVTIEGFWQDPPGYFDAIVWPNYVKEHSHLFVNGDVEGELEGTVTKPRNIVSPPDMNWSLKETLEWAVDVILDEMEKHDTQ